MASYTTNQVFSSGATSVFSIGNSGKKGDMNAVTITSIATVLTPASGKKFVLMGGTFSVSADASVLFEDNAAAAFIFRSPLLLAKTSYTFDLGTGYTSLAVDNVLKATSSAAAAITGTLYYAEQ